LTVKGYEPSFAEAERMAGLRSREEERRQEAATRGAPANAAQTAERAVQAMETVASAASESDGAVGSPEVDASAQRRPSPAAAREAGEGRARRAGDRRARVRAGIRELETSGDPRARAVRETASALVDQIYGAQEERAVARSTRDQDRQPQPERDAQVVREERQRSEEAKRHRDSEELADLFLHGAADTIAAEPRLANALQAQAAMEQHIAEVFKGDAMQVASETRDSRQMISDVLRRGLDVSVREPAPVRRIEPVQSPQHWRGNSSHGVPYEIHIEVGPDDVRSPRPPTRRLRRRLALISIAQPALRTAPPSRAALRPSRHG
jgi:hypothetical protein